MNVKPILDLIAKCESEPAASAQGVKNGYDVVVWKAFCVYPPKRPITTMTVSEVLLWQSEAIKAYQKQFKADQGYSAAGRYQIIRSTLKSLASSLYRMSDLFDEETQDIFAKDLLYRRGLTAWLRGDMSDNKFADSLSQEWASLPYNNGHSYYATDLHGNKALVSRKEVLDVLRKVKSIEVDNDL